MYLILETEALVLISDFVVVDTSVLSPQPNYLFMYDTKKKLTGSKHPKKKLTTKIMLIRNARALGKALEGMPTVI